jgi:cytochrome c oxidase assembly protein Cox11
LSSVSVTPFKAGKFFNKVACFCFEVQMLLFVGYENDIPVVIDILFISGDTAGILSLITEENKRGL